MIRDACASQVVPKAFATAKAALLTLIEPTSTAAACDSPSASGPGKRPSTTTNPVGRASSASAAVPSWASSLGDPASISLIRTKSANEIPIHYEGLTLLELADDDPCNYETR